jgi:hypothetical protein
MFREDMGIGKDIALRVKVASWFRDGKNYHYNLYPFRMDRSKQYLIKTEITHLLSLDTEIYPNWRIGDAFYSHIKIMCYDHPSIYIYMCITKSVVLFYSLANRFNR